MSNRPVQAIFGLILIFIAFILFPMVMSGTHEVRTDDATQSGNITTGVGATTGDIVIAHGGLYNDSTDSVTSVSSSNGGDTPAASSYTAATDTLTVSGLEASKTRTITVAYEYNAISDYEGMEETTSIAPTVLFVALLLSGVMMMWHSIRG